jgi:hypothetical protein
MNQTDITAWQRWIAPMPLFFKVIFYICMAIALMNAAFVAIDLQLITFEIARPIWFSKVLGYLATGAAIVAKFTVDYKKWQEEQALTGFNNNVVPIARSPLSELVTYNSLVLFTKSELTQKLTFWLNVIRNCKTNDVDYRRYQTNISNIETRIFDLDRMNSKPA